MVDSLKNNMSEELWRMSKSTWTGSVRQVRDSYTAPRYMNLPSGKDLLFGMCSEGVGTKIGFAEELGDWSTIGMDLLAMVLDDVARLGAKVLGVTTTLDLGEYTNVAIDRYIKDFMFGLARAAKECAGVPILDGEFSNLGSYIKGGRKFPLVANASAAWVVEREKLIDGSKVKPGDKIIALPEEGFRSNGFTLLRTLLKNVWGSDWHGKLLQLSTGARLIKDLVMVPSRIYYPIIRDLMETELRRHVTGLVHVTGGGVPGKLSRYLQQTKMSAVIDTSMDCVNPLMRFFFKEGYVSVQEAVQTWNQGMGFLIITSEPAPVIQYLQGYFSHFPPAVVGTITNDEKQRVSMSIQTTLDF